nr:immunoglobulin heavy chain junction region [Mus musculus]
CARSGIYDYDGNYAMDYW